MRSVNSSAARRPTYRRFNESAHHGELVFERDPPLRLGEAELDTVAWGENFLHFDVVAAAGSDVGSAVLQLRVKQDQKMLYESQQEVGVGRGRVSFPIAATGSQTIEATLRSADGKRSFAHKRFNVEVPDRLLQLLHRETQFVDIPGVSLFISLNVAEPALKKLRLQIEAGDVRHEVDHLETHRVEFILPTSALGVGDIPLKIDLVDEKGAVVASATSSFTQIASPFVER